MSHPLFFSAVKCKLKLSTVGRNISLVTILFVIVGQSFATGIRDLPSKYREWLQKDVAYIITDEEKDAFLNMAADADRDQFITRFWEVRNPTPGAPSNPYREEHYRRLEYANQYFGHEAHGGMYGFAGEIGPKDRAVYSHDRARPGRRVSASSINSRES